ncbi:bifunctional UDP-N-acetylmuramoyl-tripeptide:D-alanyl-D-alanine ligase/alanine racemase [Compostibacter hankyongensis]|uniref:Alanine racemase n=1 Tax=Compostibacter hankyongensis TaxID=1007089 RepID=A0ABP8FTR4_9BACT
MEYRVAQICKIVKGELLQGAEDRPVTHLLSDSRKLIYPAVSLFIPIVGTHRDGHQYIGELYEKGVRCFLTSRAIPAGEYPEAAFIRVKDTLRALQMLTAWHRQQFHIPVIGITGSNGKTVVKEWIYQLLESDYNIVRSPKSYNSQIGVPLSVWQMQPEHELAVFEAGISMPGEMAHIESIIRPTIGIFTNIGEAHNEGFLNVRQKINEKLVLFTRTEVLIYCKDYPELNECILQFHNHIRRKASDPEKSQRLLTWSARHEADLRVISIDKNENHTRIDALYEGQPVYIRIPFTDDGSIENAIHCWCLLLWLGTPETIIRERMEGLTNIAMRLELKQAVNNCSLINDSYNSDLGSLVIALDFLQQQQQHATRTVILSDILQSGKRDAELYEAVARLLEQKGVNRLIGIGKSISREKNSFLGIAGLQCVFFDSTEAFAEQFRHLSFQNETILLKGARVFAFERISRMLEQKVHQTVLEINLSALVHNLKQYQSLLRPSTRMMVMVKAFSYGSGSYEIASLLQFHQVDYLAVAYADEGVELRRAGITLPVMVMNPEPGTFDAIIQWQLEPEIYSLQMLDLFEQELKKPDIREFPIHIKLDTGMHRLGFEPQHLETLSGLLRRSPHLRVKSVFSHLAASEDPQQDDFTRQQGELFLRMSDTLQKALPYTFLRHIANSAAIERHPDLQLDMVRLGIGLHGLSQPGGPLHEKLHNVSTLRTTVSQLKKIPPGDTVGYGRQGKAPGGMTIATVAIGYADGYIRRLGNGRGHMLVQEQLAPVIGNVCMDMLMLDVSAIPEVQEGDEVIVFGPDLPISRLAEWAGTIPYEIMTGISQRVKRVYFQE